MPLKTLDETLTKWAFVILFVLTFQGLNSSAPNVCMCERSTSRITDINVGLVLDDLSCDNCDH